MKNKKNLISLSRNKNNKNLNLFLSTSSKKEKNQIFKTTQEDSKKLMDKYARGLSKKEINTSRQNIRIIFQQNLCLLKIQIQK